MKPQIEELCGWHGLLHKENSTTGLGMRNYLKSDGKKAPAYNCLGCNGLNVSCDMHQNYVPRKRSKK